MYVSRLGTNTLKSLQYPELEVFLVYTVESTIFYLRTLSQNNKKSSSRIPENPTEIPT